jgi:hypothetical protein
MFESQLTTKNDIITRHNPYYPGCRISINLNGAQPDTPQYHSKVAVLRDAVGPRSEQIKSPLATEFKLLRELQAKQAKEKVTQ